MTQVITTHKNTDFDAFASLVDGHEDAHILIDRFRNGGSGFWIDLRGSHKGE